MTLAALVADTLLPGDGPLPPASAALGPLEDWGASHAALLAGLADFRDASPEARVAALRAAEEAVQAAFASALGDLLARYHAAPAVLKALGWRAEPPQPRGHAVPEASTETWARLDRVRARGPIWRPA